MTLTKNIAVAGFAALILGACTAAPTGPQTVDLGQVLDRTEMAINGFQSYAEQEGVEELSNADMQTFRSFLGGVYNSEPRFYDRPMGVSLEEDGSFLGFVDANMNDVQDAGEDDLFTVEIDAENERLIATDMAGQSSGLRFSSGGFLTGLIVGRMLSRQSSAGIARGSFNNRTVTPRSSYRAPASARSRVRSGGVRSGK